MKKRKSKGRPQIVYSTCRALIPLDTEKIRKSTLKKLKKSKSDCASLDAKLTRFEREEKQAYRQWLQTHCGAAITEFQTIHAEADLLQNTIKLACDLIDHYYGDRKEHECTEAAVLFFESNGNIPEGFEEFFAPPSAQDGYDDEQPEEHDAEEDDDMWAEMINDLLNRVHMQNMPTYDIRDEWQQNQTTFDLF